MSDSWWIAENSANNTGFVFQAPNYGKAASIAGASGDTVATAQPYATKAGAVSEAQLLGITLQSGGGSPSPPQPQPPGAPWHPGGKLDRHTIGTVTQWVINQVGHCYIYGGAMGANLRGCPDCSSFCNAAWGVVGNQAIPGYPAGTYDGSQHGPTTIGWLSAQGSVVGSVPRDQAQEGDLATWQTHMGYCISNSEMISAQNETNGVQRSGIDGFISGETLTILRLTVVGPGGISFPLPSGADAGRIDAVTRQIAEDSRKLVAVRMRLYNMNRISGRG